MFEKALSSKKELAHVDMAQSMADSGLDKFFLVECWPEAMAVRELATKVKTLTKAGQAKPFVAVELKKYASLNVLPKS